MANGIYSNAALKMQQGSINLLTDSLKYALMAPTYTPNLDTDTIFTGGINANEASGTGYTAGGLATTSPSDTLILANSWTGVWAANTTYALGTMVRPSTANGFIYKCVGAGASGAAAPAWGTTSGLTTADNAAIWLNVGTMGTKFTTAAPSWPASTITARYGVLYDLTANASGLLLALTDFGANLSSTNGTFQVTPDVNAGWMAVNRI